jgi:CheY-like chemotaxis protein
MEQTPGAQENVRQAADGRLLVLLVEDQPLRASLLARLVDGLGHEARVAPDGPSALERANHESPDVVLPDIGLPGMDGYEVARRPRGDSGRKPLLISRSARSILCRQSLQQASGPGAGPARAVRVRTRIRRGRAAKTHRNTCNKGAYRHQAYPLHQPESRGALPGPHAGSGH